MKDKREQKKIGSKCRVFAVLLCMAFAIFFVANGLIYASVQRSGILGMGEHLTEVGVWGDGLSCAAFAQYNRLYMGSGRTMIIHDTSIPTAPQKMGSVTLDTFIYSIYVSGDYAYAAIWDKGLQVVDVSDPYHPRVLGICDTPGIAREVYVQGIYAYVADYDKGLRIIDVSNPSAPTEVGCLDTPGQAWGVCVSGNYAYVADHSEGLRIINVSTPSAPFEVTHLDFSGDTEKVVISGIYAYAADYMAGVNVINISVPEAPVIVGVIYNLYGTEIFVSGNYLYKGGSSGYFYIFNISNPASPYKVGEFWNKSQFIYDISVSANYAYVAAADYGVRILDVSNVAAPVEAANIDTPHRAMAVDVSGNYAYIANDKDGLQIIDILNPTAPCRVGFLGTPGYAYSVRASGNYAFVGEAGGYLRIINVSNPASPTLVGTWSNGAGVNGLDVRGNYVYVANASLGLKVIDVTNPAAPTQVGSLDTPGSASDVMVSGNYAYIADFQNGLYIANISNPTAPFYVGSLPASNIRSLYVSGSYAYLAEYGLGLRIVNIQNPASPTVVGSHGGFSYRINVKGSYAFVAGGTNEVRVLDISNPASPVEVAYNASLLCTFGIDISNNYAYVANGECELSIFDVSNYTSFIRVTAPNGGENWEEGTEQSITWTSPGIIGNVKIEYTPDNMDTWIEITSSTENSGTFTWTIPQDSSSQCRVRVTDSTGTISDVSDAVFTITPPPSLTLTTPNGGENWEGGASNNITWTSTGAIDNVKLEYSINNGSSWDTIIDSIANSGFYNWTVPNSPSTNCLVKVSDIDGPASDQSNAVFTVVTGRTVTVTAPNGGESIEGNTSYSITWATTGNIPNVKIEYSTSSGSSWNTIAASTANTGSYNWTVANTASTNCLAKVSDIDGPASDQSNAVFTIVAYRSITVTSPNGGESWEGNTSYPITWTSTGSIVNVMIEYSTNNGSSWNTIAASTANSGSYNWTVPDTPFTTCLVKISDVSGPASDQCNAVFAIVAYRTITVTLPNGAENLLANTIYPITWTNTGSIPNVKIEYSTNNGSSWNTITASTTNIGSYNWTIPASASTSCLVKVSDAAGPALDQSNAVFTISNVTYCTSSGSSQTRGYISSVQVGSLDNSSGSSTYSNFTALNANVTSGGSAGVSLTPTFPGSTYTEYWKIWIDYNRDGDFADSGENVYSGSGKTTKTGSFTVPSATLKGTARMRVSMRSGSNPSNCGSFNYGEVEDYTVNIQ